RRQLAELAVLVDEHRHRAGAAAQARPIDAGDEGAGLDTAQPHGGRFCAHPRAAQVDVEVPAAEMDAGIVPQGGVAAPPGIDLVITQIAAVYELSALLRLRFVMCACRAITFATPASHPPGG